MAERPILRRRQAHNVGNKIGKKLSKYFRMKTMAYPVDKNADNNNNGKNLELTTEDRLVRSNTIWKGKRRAEVDSEVEFRLKIANKKLDEDKKVLDSRNNKGESESGSESGGSFEKPSETLEEDKKEAKYPSFRAVMSERRIRTHTEGSIPTCETPEMPEIKEESSEEKEAATPCFQRGTTQPMRRRSTEDIERVHVVREMTAIKEDALEDKVDPNEAENAAGEKEMKVEIAELSTDIKNATDKHKEFEEKAGKIHDQLTTILINLRLKSKGTN